ARREVGRKTDARPDDPTALHELRIACKRLRYTTEIFAEALPPAVAGLAEPAARWQKRLGEIHDLDVARVVIARTRSLSPAVKARVLEAIARARGERIERWAHDRAAHPLHDRE